MRFPLPAVQPLNGSDNFAELEHSKAQKEEKNVYAELDSMVSDSTTGILVLPHFAGAATTYMDNVAKAAFVGVTLETTKYDLYQALMEGTSYEMLLNFNKMSALTGKIDEIRASGGGAASDIRLQIKADILNSEITALAAKEVGSPCTDEGEELPLHGTISNTPAQLCGIDETEEGIIIRLKISDESLFGRNLVMERIRLNFYENFLELFRKLFSQIAIAS